MNLIDLAYEANLNPKKSSSTNGGEYKTHCPNCQEGKDRFCIWPSQGTTGRYWCRVCDAKGDGIQFCRDFLGMSFQESCQRFQVKMQSHPSTGSKLAKKPRYCPKKALPASQAWLIKAQSFIDFSHLELMKAPRQLEELSKRGLSLDTIKQFYLGWNPQQQFENREYWGLSQERKESGQPRCQWLPKGIVIPSFSKDKPTKLKIRRVDWFKEDVFPKYTEVSGSRQVPSIYGDQSKPVIIVESELDAILVQQEAADLVCCMSLGGVSKKPDLQTDTWLKCRPLILLSLDFDEPGKKGGKFWIKNYVNLQPWPIPITKSVGDAYEKFQFDVFNWIKKGLLSR